MFEQFTEQSIQVVNSARDEARRLGHETLGLEHIFLALMGQNGGTASRAFAETGVKQSDARVAIGHTTSRVRGKPPQAIPLGPEATDFFRATIMKAMERDDASVGPEELLLGLFEFNDPTVNRMCKVLDVNVSAVRSRCQYFVVENAAPTAAVEKKLASFLKAKKEQPFSEQAKIAMKIAQDRTKLAGRQFAGTEQILLGIVCGDSAVAQDLLWRKGISLTLLSTKIRQLLGDSTNQIVSNVEFTPTAKRVLVHAQFEASRRKQDTGIAHIVFGLLEEESCTAFKILNDLEVDIKTLRKELLEILDSEE